MKNTPRGDGNGFGVILALIMLVAGAATFVANVGLSRAVYLVRTAVYSR
jgi:hypothetical protein